MELVAQNMNHIALDHERYFLLPTFPFLSSYYKAVNNLIERMNYILKYEELPLDFPDGPLQRWGTSREQNYYQDSHDQSTQITIGLIDIQTKEKVSAVFELILNEENTTNTPHIINQSISPNSEENVKSEETDMDMDLDLEIIELIMPDLINIYKNKEYNNELTSLLSEIQEIYNEYSGFQTDSILEHISDAVTDLTLFNDDDNCK